MTAFRTVLLGFASLCLIAVGVQAQENASTKQAAAREAASKGRQYFVAPTGRANGDGSFEAPWDFQTALNQPPAVRPGDGIWLRGGTYGSGRTQFTSKLSGTKDAPIVVRQWPGERATIDGGIAVYGPYTWYRDFEVTSTVSDRGPDQKALDGFDTYEGSVGTKFINLVIHDDSEGIGFWDKATDAEIYGCIIYHNGFQGPDRGHGHGIYTQNRVGTKHIRENIIFGQYGWGIHAYGSGSAGVDGYDVEGNIVFNNGELSGQFTSNILFGGGAPMSRIKVISNYTYFPKGEGDSELGWPWSPANQDIVATDNYWIGGYFALSMWNWQSVTFSRNTFYTNGLLSMAMSVVAGQNPATYNWNQNKYYGSGGFRVNGQNQALKGWLATGVDAKSEFVQQAPRGSWIFVRPNAYEKGRANIAIYNWDLKKTVEVDLSSVLKPTDGFEIRDAQNFFGPPVVAGTYDGKPVSVPMTGLTRVAPVGNVAHRPNHTAPEFGSFVVLPRRTA